MREFMKIVETAAPSYIHSSWVMMEVGTVLEPRKSPGALAATSPTEAIFEEVRPATMPSRLSSVYMTDDWDTLEGFGLADDMWVYAVSPQGPTARFDHDWLRDAMTIGMRGMIDDGIRADLKKMAKRYWSGKAMSDYPNWEYLAPSATITSILQEAENHLGESTKAA